MNVTSTVAGSVVYPPGGRFGPRIQQDIQLVMLYTGEMSVTVDGRELHVQPGHVVLLLPGHEEQFVFSKTEDTWHRWIAVHVQQLEEETRESFRLLPEVLPLNEDMNRLTDLLLRLQRDASPSDSVMLQLGLAALHLYPVESRRTLHQKEKHPAIYSALSWIREHYAQEVTLKEIAAFSKVSPEHLVRLFKQYEQATPFQYLWNFRIQKAVELLTNTGLTVTEIALRCGFKTSHHFARQLKQATGRTASEIRQLSWSGLRKA
ncbi:AraC family transcriptional regulator [Paenibacillus glycanilyticus]|uniref:AraC family transcriptional regulator n=1 Tax=Paenibacillus glycanilyticus TaxID=126569 RepID=UPI002041C5DB|nr:AraC family transcriptional regulator [Paenibacillus glycanilyticus]MCM3626974.1 AraC family transcriptional regulator [Paenibacillus glycanilyticus]